jgi:hypothetical protein
MSHLRSHLTYEYITVFQEPEVGDPRNQEDVYGLEELVSTIRS